MQVKISFLIALMMAIPPSMAQSRDVIIQTENGFEAVPHIVWQKKRSNYIDSAKRAKTVVQAFPISPSVPLAPLTIRIGGKGDK